MEIENSFSGVEFINIINASL